MATSEDKELKQRLGLYQVFLKLYEHHRGLLDEILKLESLDSPSVKGAAPRYVQGVVQNNLAYIITNIRASETQTLNQPQRIWTIGRDRTCAIPSGDKWLSRRHAAIQYIEDQGFYLVDFDSTNGSFVNGEPVLQRTLLKDGDQVRLGSLVFSFFFTDCFRTIAAVPSEISKHLLSNSVAEISTPNTFIEMPLEESDFGSEFEIELPTVPVDQEIPVVTVEPKDTSLFLREHSLKDSGGTPAPKLSADKQSEILDRFLDKQRHDDPS